MINYSPRKIIKLDIFKNGLKNIYDRDVESNFFFSMYEMQSAVIKSMTLIQEHERQLKKRRRRLNIKLKKAAFDFEQVNELR